MNEVEENTKKNEQTGLGRLGGTAGRTQRGASGPLTAMAANEVPPTETLGVKMNSDASGRA